MITRRIKMTRGVRWDAFWLGTVLGAIPLGLFSPASAHGLKQASFRVTATVVCNVTGNNKNKTKCKKNALMSVAPLSSPGSGLSTLRTLRQPTVWIDTIDPSKSFSSILDRENGFPPSESSELDLDF